MDLQERGDDELPIAVQARERSLRFLDFLEAYYLQRYPPIYDISAYRDVQVAPADLPGPDAGTAFMPGGESWLQVDLLDPPPPPPVPEDLRDWITGADVAIAIPSVDHPDSEARALLELLDSQHFADDQHLDTLDSDQLAAWSITSTRPGHVLDAARRADEERRRATLLFQDWLETAWQPWATRWLAIDAGRSFYKKLFDLRSRLDRQRETFELVWGFGRTRWATTAAAQPVRVDHPMLTVSMEMSVDRRSGRITVAPAAPAAVEGTWTVGLPLSDREGYAHQRATAEQIEIEPWGPGRTETLRALLRALDQDGRLASEDGPVRFGEQAVADPDGWVLYVRRRRPNFQGFLDTQRRLYADGEDVPAPFAALVVDNPSRLDDHLPSLSQADGSEPEASPVADIERDLLPLPANQEQLEIVALARSRAGVTAQGPPGTGKSHTIANLISHYVAHGRRVLVTAQKEQALQVLMDKVPEQIRALCVPVVGSDAVARGLLQAAVSEIAARSQQNPDLLAIARLTSELDSIEARYAETTNLLRARRAAETTAPPNRPAGIAGSDWSPSSAARWVSSTARLAGIPDRIGPDAAPPLSADEFTELVRLCADITAADSVAALSELPDPKLLPPAGHLATMRAEVGRAQQALDAIAERVTDWEAVDGSGQEAVAEMSARLEKWVDWHTKAAGTWVGSVLRDARDQSLAAVWFDFCRDAHAEREQVLAINRMLAAAVVAMDIPADSLPPPEMLAGLNEARARLAAGKSVGAFQRSARRALDVCTTNGHAPATAAEVDLVLADITRREQRQRLANRWINISARISAPPLATERPVEDVIGEHIGQVMAALQWGLHTWPALRGELEDMGVRVPPAGEGSDLDGLAQVCRTLAYRFRLNEIREDLRLVGRVVDAGRVQPAASPLWDRLALALSDADDASWDALRAEAARLQSLQPAAQRRRDLYERIRTAAPQLTSAIGSGSPPPIDPARFEDSWRYRQVQCWLDDLDSGTQPAELQARLEQLTTDRRRVTGDLVAARAWVALSESIDDRRRIALNRFTRANAKIGKGTGKYAPMWAGEARAAMADAQDAVPVWIMPINRALDSFRPAARPPFDVIIIDEASQVGLLETPILGLGRRAIVVGDDQQTSPENVGLHRQDVLDLIDDYLGAIRDRRTRFDPDSSLYDISRQRFPQVVQLREHFRCLPRIIEFSSQNWYSGTIVPLRDRPPHPGWQPVGTVFVPSGIRRYSDDTNEAEAQAIIDLIAELAADEAYAGMTFGVVTLQGSGQAPLITSMMVDQLGPRFIEERDLRVGEPAGFQGDERDVIILSTVVSHDPDRRIGAMTTAAAGRRINVAASRARNQLWMVHSVDADVFRPDDPRRWLLEYCSSPLEDSTLQAEIDKTESDFEREVLARILARGYSRVQAQYPVGGYRIDLVVEGPESRLAVECDGDFWHGPEMWDRDRARQTVLERAGWTFERIRGSAFYRDPDAALQPLWQRLEKLGIPTGAWTDSNLPQPARRVWPDDFPNRRSALESIRAEQEQVEEAVIPAQTVQTPAPNRLEHLVQLPPRVDGSYRLSKAMGPTSREVRDWARSAGHSVGERGRLHPDVVAAWNLDHPDRPFTS